MHFELTRHFQDCGMNCIYPPCCESINRIYSATSLNASDALTLFVIVSMQLGNLHHATCHLGGLAGFSGRFIWFQGAEE